MLWVLEDRTPNAGQVVRRYSSVAVAVVSAAAVAVRRPSADAVAAERHNEPSVCQSVVSPDRKRRCRCCCCCAGADADAGVGDDHRPLAEDRTQHEHWAVRTVVPALRTLCAAHAPARFAFAAAVAAAHRAVVTDMCA